MINVELRIKILISVLVLKSSGKDIELRRVAHIHYSIQSNSNNSFKDVFFYKFKYTFFISNGHNVQHRIRFLSFSLFLRTAEITIFHTKLYA